MYQKVTIMFAASQYLYHSIVPVCIYLTIVVINNKFN